MNVKLLSIVVTALLLSGCKNVTVNYKSNVDSRDSQINQSTSTDATIPLR